MPYTFPMNYRDWKLYQWGSHIPVSSPEMICRCFPHMESTSETSVSDLSFFPEKSAQKSGE